MRLYVYLCLFTLNIDRESNHWFFSFVSSVYLSLFKMIVFFFLCAHITIKINSSRWHSWCESFVVVLIYVIVNRTLYLATVESSCTLHLCNPNSLFPISMQIINNWLDANENNMIWKYSTMMIALHSCSSLYTIQQSSTRFFFFLHFYFILNIFVVCGTMT